MWSFTCAEIIALSADQTIQMPILVEAACAAVSSKSMRYLPHVWVAAPIQ